DRLPDDHEQVRLHPAGADQRTLDAEEVGTAGAPGDRVRREPVTDGACRRRRQSRIPLQEGIPDPAARRDWTEEAGGEIACVDGLIDHPLVVRDEGLDAIRMRDGVGTEGQEAKDADAEAAEGELQASRRRYRAGEGVGKEAAEDSMDQHSL